MARQHHARAAHPRMTRLLVALLVLVALLASPAPGPRAMPETLAFDTALVICHAGTEDGAPSHAPAPVPSHDLDCKLCPACHIAVQPVLPVGDAGFVVTVLAAAPAHAAALPPATGPPRPLSPAAPPTGPPAASA